MSGPAGLEHGGDNIHGEFERTAFLILLYAHETSAVPESESGGLFGGS